MRFPDESVMVEDKMAGSFLSATTIKDTLKECDEDVILFLAIMVSVSCLIYPLT